MPISGGYNGLYNVNFQQINDPPGSTVDGLCYFCGGSTDLNGLIWLDPPTGRFRAFVPTGTYTLYVIRSPFYGEPSGTAQLPGWGPPITFRVDMDTEIHVRRDLKKIEGRVTSPNGQGLGGVRVVASPLGPTGAAQATSDAQGRYSMLAERGQYRLLPQANGRVTVMINIFGGSAPVELEYWQIEAV